MIAYQSFLATRMAENKACSAEDVSLVQTKGAEQPKKILMRVSISERLKQRCSEW